MKSETAVNQQGHDGQSGGLESLAELVALWRQGTERYDREFLAATICADLGRHRRLAQAETHPQDSPEADATEHIREAQALVGNDPRLARCALADVYAQGLVEAIQDFADAFARRQLTEEELADEGLRLLFDYDSLHLILGIVAQASLSPAAYKHLRHEQQVLRQAAALTERNFLAFRAAAPLVNSYCLAWNVEEDNVLSRVARLSSREAEMLWMELTRAPASLPGATPECPEENHIALAFAGQLAARQQEIFDRHLENCGHCRSLLDLLTATFARLPAVLPAAPQSALPQELRRPGFLKKLQKSLQQITQQISERVREFFVPPFVLSQPALVRGEAAATPPSVQFEEILWREVLIETPDVQVVLFPRGRKLYLSALGNRLRIVRSLRLIDMKTHSTWPTEKTNEEGVVCLGEATNLCNKQLQISFRVGKKRYQTRILVRVQGGSQA